MDIEAPAAPSVEVARELNAKIAVRLLLALALLLICIAAVFFISRLQVLAGEDLGAAPAPGFSLVDQDGQQISLEQFQGKPVVVTFLYTNCPDACPLIAAKLRRTIDLLGPDSERVSFLAVSTDPRHDDRLAAQKFTQAHDLQGRWHYLIGSPEQLQPIWKNYFVGVAAGESGDVSFHTDPLFVIDKTGRERVLLGDDFRSEDLAGNLRKLLR